VFDPARFEPDLRAMTRIVLRPIGSPMPLGFFTVAIDSVLVSALQVSEMQQSRNQSPKCSQPLTPTPTTISHATG
jgi:hypothetical protein